LARRTLKAPCKADLVTLPIDAQALKLGMRSHLRRGAHRPAIQRILKSRATARLLELLPRQRPPVPVPLRFIAPRAYEIIKLRLLLDALGYRRHVKGMRQADNCRYERATLAVGREAACEGPIDFESVDRQFGQAPERGITRPEIINRDTHARSAQEPQDMYAG